MARFFGRPSGVKIACIDKARTEVVRLIALDEAFDSFTDACTWPDHPRKRAEEHFIDVPRTLQTIAIAKRQGVPTCLFTAIVTDREVLRASNDDQACARGKG